MNSIKKNKKVFIFVSIFIFLGLFTLLLTNKDIRESISHSLANLTGSNDANANRIKVSKASIKSISTGTESFDSSDGIVDPSSIEGYIPGNDSSPDNRIVRSFDTITYNFDFNIIGKDTPEAFTGRTVDLNVELTSDEASYVSFYDSGITGETNHTYSFDGINSDEINEKSITLYVLGAPNGMNINPKFTIKESTDEENEILLGKVSSNDIYYSFENDTYNSVASFDNILPSVVSSKTANIKVEYMAVNDNPIATYNGQNGRYITSVLGLYIEGDPSKGIKGMDMPTGNININTAVSHNGQNYLVLKNEWARLYGSSNVSDLESILVDAPYSAHDSGNAQKEVSSPGDFYNETTDNNYSTTIANYNISNSFPTLTATDQGINGKYYIGTYAYTVFSPRTPQEGKKNISVNFTTNSVSVMGTNNESYQIDNASVSVDNTYAQSANYVYDSGFYVNDEKLNNEYKIGSISRGTEILYKTTFDYKKTSTNEGLKEIIKLNPNAFRIVNFDKENEIKIELKCNGVDCSNITKDDFEIKYLTGDYKNTNYIKTDIDSRISEEEKPIIRTLCENLDLTDLNNDQMMNIYGNPCLKAKDDVEKEFTKIDDAKDSSNEEIPITKIIVQTKSGVTLPDSVKVEMTFKLKVRNVKDSTRLYQVLSLATNSEYDTILNYYSPAVNDTLDIDNYKLPKIEGNNITNITEYPYGDSIRISSYTSDQKISVLNKDTNDKMKTHFNTSDSETIMYNIKPILDDNSESVGSDDTWFVKSIRFSIHLPSNLTYVPDSNLDKYLSNVVQGDNETILEYALPYTKPNIEIEDIRFNAIINPKLKGTDIPITISSYISAINANDEIDNSLFGVSHKEFTIYASGEDSIILEQRVGNVGSTVDKNEEFSYLLYAYNNSDNQVENYNIADILPFNNDENGSKINGTYEVKINKPESLNAARIYCSTEDSENLANTFNDAYNNWAECTDITSDYKAITAFKVTNISIPKDTYIEPIEVIIKPSGNKTANVYINEFVGGLTTTKLNKSNKTSVDIISRSISGKVFYDNDRDGLQGELDEYVPGVSVKLFKIAEQENTEIGSVTTDENGKYVFEDLEKGRYFIEIGYDGSSYDLTRRYASIDESIDSDAYKISSKVARIANKRIPDDPFGILVGEDSKSLDNFDMGLIPRYNFGFDIKKYITRTELSYLGNFTGKDYNKETRVFINVNNTTNANIKVYYGIDITNNSSMPGYVDEIEESIPTGMVFDTSLPENKDWFMLGGKAISNSLEKTLISPGETKHLKIVLSLNNNQSAGSFINTVTIAKMREYVPETLIKEKEYNNTNKYEVGEAVDFAGLSWHVINVADIDGKNQNVTLLADSGEIDTLMSHNDGGLYKWGLSNIKSYLDSNGMGSSLDYSVLDATMVCNDASGLEIISYGGNIGGMCQSNDFIPSKVRLLSAEEYTKLITSSLSNIDWLIGDRDYWLQTSDDTRPIYQMIGANQDDSYGTLQTSTYNKAMYVSTSGLKSDLASAEKEVRPVITISSNNILFE